MMDNHRQITQDQVLQQLPDSQCAAQLYHSDWGPTWQWWQLHIRVCLLWCGVILGNTHTHPQPCPHKHRVLYGEQARFFEHEIRPHLRHKNRGMVGMVGMCTWDCFMLVQLCGMHVHNNTLQHACVAACMCVSVHVCAHTSAHDHLLLYIN